MPDHAIVIGINTYPGLNNLDGACNDAEFIRDWLLRGDGGNIAPANLVETNTENFPGITGVQNAHPTREDVEALFRPLVTQAVAAGPIGDRLFVFAAGHGFADSNDINSAALFAANAEFLFPLHVAIMEYVRFLERAYAFEEIIVIMDSCRSTNPIHYIAAPTLPNIPPNPNAHKVKLFVGFGAAFDQLAREREMNGVKRGIFTAAVIDALENAEPNRLGRVTGTIVKAHVHNVIDKYAGDVDIAPVDIYADDRKDVLFIARESSGVAVEFEISVHHMGNTLVVLFGGTVEVDRNAIGAATLSLPLKPGLYSAKIEETGEQVNFEVPSHEKINI